MVSFELFWVFFATYKTCGSVLINIQQGPNLMLSVISGASSGIIPKIKHHSEKAVYEWRIISEVSKLMKINWRFRLWVKADTFYKILYSCIYQYIFGKKCLGYFESFCAFFFHLPNIDFYKVNNIRIIAIWLI